METPGAVLPFAFVAAAAGNTQLTAGAQELRVLSTATSGVTTVPVAGDMDPGGVEQPGFATLLARLRTSSIEQSGQPRMVSGRLIEASEPVSNTVSDIASESIEALPTQSFLEINELLPYTQQSASGTLLPEPGNILPPGANETSATDGARDALADSRLASRNQLPGVRVKMPPQTSSIEDRSPPDRAAVEIPPFLSSLTLRPITAAQTTDASRPPVGLAEPTVTRANIFEQIIPAVTIESATGRNTNEQPNDALTKPQPSDSGHGDFFQPTLPPFSSRASLTDSGLVQSLDLSLPSDKAPWAEPLAQRLAWLIHKGADTAELRLNPPHLGRVEVRISVQNDQASVWLSAADPEVREMLEQALPRLNGLLENSGLELADAGITEDGLMEANHHALATQDDDSSEQVEPPNHSHKLLLGLIDTYV